VTPMIHARLVTESVMYRKKFLGTWLAGQDRPLIAQLCGSDPHVMLAAAREVEPYVDGIDINCGCPQGIARRGNYGAFLLEQEDTLLPLVKHLVAHLKVPLSVKVRLLPPPDQPANSASASSPNDDPTFDIPTASLALYGKLIDAGVHLLTIHGRTRKQKQDLTGRADWDTIARAVELYGNRIPIFANGGIENYDDVEECIRLTNVDGVMSSESVLEYPPLFYKIPQTPKRTIGRYQLACEYIELAKTYPPDRGGQGSGLKCIRTHIHRMLHKDFQDDTDLRTKVVGYPTLESMEEVLILCREKHERENHTVESETLSWYRRHQDAPDKSQLAKSQLEAAAAMKNDDDDEEEDDIAECGCSTLFDAKEGGDY
jgi:tRNA-dihydrouridine synthase 1